MEYRNARYDQNGTVTLEINHPVHGWIPFTASKDDIEEFGRQVYAEVIKTDVAPYVGPAE